MRWPYDMCTAPWKRYITGDGAVFRDYAHVERAVNDLLENAAVVTTSTIIVHELMAV